jgi:hypothetical protein
MNMKTTTRILITIATIFALGLAQRATALTLGAPTTRYMRQQNFVVPQIRTLATSAAASCTIATGTAAVAADQRPTLTLSTYGIAGYTAWTAGDTVLTISSTTANPIGPLAYAGRVHVVIFDGGSGSVPTCTRFQLEGTNIQGDRVTENVASTILEGGSGYLSREIYRSLTRVTASGCSAFDTSDELHVRNGPWVAVPTDLATTPVRDLQQVCMTRDGNGFRCVAGSAFTLYKAPGASRAGSGTAINMLSAAFTPGVSPGNCLPDRMPVVIRYFER